MDEIKTGVAAKLSVVMTAGIGFPTRAGWTQAPESIR